MDYTFGTYALLAMVIGAVLGITFGIAINYTPTLADFRAITGLFVGWFLIAGLQHRSKFGNDNEGTLYYAD